MLRLRGAVHEVPLPERPFVALDDQQRLAGKHEEVLLIGLPVVHRHRLAGRQGDEMDADLWELRLAFEETISPSSFGGTPARLARSHLPSSVQ